MPYNPKLLTPQPEALADFLQCGSAIASGSIIQKTGGKSCTTYWAGD